VGVTPVVWVEPPKGASKKDVGARPEAQRRGDVHYRVTIRVANKTFVLGTFIAEDDAAKAHDRALIRACGPEAMHVYWADQLGLMAAKLDVAEAVAAAGEAAGMPAVGPALSPLPPLTSWLALNYPVWVYAGDPLDWYALLPVCTFCTPTQPPLTIPRPRPRPPSRRFTEFDEKMRSELLLATSWKGPRPCDFGFIVNFPPGARHAWDRQLARLLALYRPVGAAPQPPPPPALVVLLDSDDDGDGDNDGNVEGGRAAAAATAAVAGLNQAAGGRGGGGIGRRRRPSDPMLAPVEAVLMVDDEDDEDKEDEGEDVEKAEDGDAVAGAVEVAQPAGEGTAGERNGDSNNVGDGSDVGDNGGNNADNGVDDGEAIEAAAPVRPALSAASVDSNDEMPVYFGAGASMRTE
jgi:hypothetical protein